MLWTYNRNMFTIRPKDERGKTESLWLDSSHSFSFAQYYDPNYMGFSDLRVLNDDVIRPEGGFSLHHHDNMEIITIILSGRLEHKDSLGSKQVLHAGEIQVMTAGSGVMHSEYNPSSEEDVHFLQIWILTDTYNLPPEYNVKFFPEKELLNEFKLIVSHDGRNGSLKINQDADLYRIFLEKVKGIVNFELNIDRKYWIQVAQGNIKVNNQVLKQGDGLAIKSEKGFLEIDGIAEKSDILLFNLAK